MTNSKFQTSSKKSKIVAGLLAIFFGGFGIHKFYLGKVGWGIACILLSWTWMPMLFGFFEGIYYLIMSDKAFQEKYSN